MGQRRGGARPGAQPVVPLGEQAGSASVPPSQSNLPFSVGGPGFARFFFGTGMGGGGLVTTLGFDDIVLLA